MKTKYFPLIALTALSYAAPSYAVDVINTYSWDDGDKSGVDYTVSSTDSTRIFYATISHSENGDQRLYFYDIDSDVFVVPEYKRSSKLDSNTSIMLEMMRKPYPITTVTMVFNGQAIKMTKFTERVSTTDKNYYYFTPETEKGHNHLINLFKKSQSSIKLQYLSETFFIPSKGFTKKWNSTGGDAI